MTKQEYKEYQERVESFLERENLAYPSTDGDGFNFSWRECECCGGEAGGRTTLHTVSMDDGFIYNYQVCGDCEYYFTYGKLDDLSMMEIEESA